MFKLDPTLEKDSLFMTKLKLCQLRLMNDKRFPWFILIPERPKLTEWFDLNESDSQLLNNEIIYITGKMKSYFSADKMNVASFGNQVSQLHIHLLARKKTDAAWPFPIWGRGTSESYEKEEGHNLIQSFNSYLL